MNINKVIKKLGAVLSTVVSEVHYAVGLLLTLAINTVILGLEVPICMVYALIEFLPYGLMALVMTVDKILRNICYPLEYLFTKVNQVVRPKQASAIIKYSKESHGVLSSGHATKRDKAIAGFNAFLTVIDSALPLMLLFAPLYVIGVPIGLWYRCFMLAVLCIYIDHVINKTILSSSLRLDIPWTGVPFAYMMARFSGLPRFGIALFSVWTWSPSLIQIIVTGVLPVIEPIFKSCKFVGGALLSLLEGLESFRVPTEGNKFWAKDTKKEESNRTGERISEACRTGGRALLSLEIFNEYTKGSKFRERATGKEAFNTRTEVGDIKDFEQGPVFPALN